MSTIAITMRLFGAFRNYGPSVEFPVPSGSTIADIKDALAKVLGVSAKNLVADSAIADTQTILPGDYVVSADAKLSILPPVCGG